MAAVCYLFWYSYKAVAGVSSLLGAGADTIGAAGEAVHNGYNGLLDRMEEGRVQQQAKQDAADRDAYVARATAIRLRWGIKPDVAAGADT